jgi:hypothetical protein
MKLPRLASFPLDTAEWLRELGEFRSSLGQPAKRPMRSSLDEVREDRWCKPLVCDTSLLLGLKTKFPKKSAFESFKT